VEFGPHLLLHPRRQGGRRIGGRRGRRPPLRRRKLLPLAPEAGTESGAVRGMGAARPPNRAELKWHEGVGNPREPYKNL